MQMGGRLIIKLDICMFGEGMRSDPTNDFIFLHLTGRSKIPWITFVQFLVGQKVDYVMLCET